MSTASGAVGIGARAPHFAELVERRPALDFLEVHSENFFGGGPPLAWLERLRARYAVSLHGVGLSLGSADPLDRRHLESLKRLVDRFEPMHVSEHLSWSSAGGRHAHELLPMPFTEEAVAHLAARIGRVQDFLGRELLVENVSTYAAMGEAAMPEWTFVAAVARRAGCRLLLDVNNVWVNAGNHGFDAGRYLDAIPAECVGQVHLGGHEVTDQGLVDTHGTRVCEAVWTLYARLVRRIGARPTLIEWDSRLPPLDLLLDEARRARTAVAAEAPMASVRAA